MKEKELKIELSKLLAGLKTPANYAKVTPGKSGKPVTRQHISKLINDGELPAIKIDGSVFVITDKELEESIKKYYQKTLLKNT
jgi:hypothetical protein